MMENLLEGIPGYIYMPFLFQDSEHLVTLETVAETGLHLKKEKCMVPSVTYFGF